MLPNQASALQWAQMSKVFANMQGGEGFAQPPSSTQLAIADGSPSLPPPAQHSAPSVPIVDEAGWAVMPNFDEFEEALFSDGDAGDDKLDDDKGDDEEIEAPVLESPTKWSSSGIRLSPQTKSWENDPLVILALACPPHDAAHQAISKKAKQTKKDSNITKQKAKTTNTKVAAPSPKELF